MGDLQINTEYKSIQQLQDAFVKFKKLCNQEPNKKHNKFTKQNYTPISEVENALDELFYLGWRCEVIKYELILNSFCVHLRIHYTHPVTGKEEWTDGLGACPIQTNAAAKPMDTTNIKSAAIQMSLPAAKAYALKDAAECFGKKFGRDVARDHVAEFEPIIKTTEEKESAYSKAVTAWKASSKDQKTLDKFLSEARKQGIYKEFLNYVQGVNNEDN